MRKITFLLALALMCNVSAFSTRYLVQLGTTGAAEWTATTGGTVVDLTTEGKTLNAWLNTMNGTLVDGDEVWVVAGTYVVSAVYNVPEGGLAIYGGFAGTETTLAERAKGTNPWDFTNETIIDGNNAVAIFGSSGGNRKAIYDGLTLTKAVNSGNNGGAILTRCNDGANAIRNCKFISNTAGQGGAVFMWGGSEISDSYFYGNSGTTHGGGIFINNSAGGSANVSNCLFDSNTTVGQGGAIRSQSPSISTIDNCIFKNNSADNNGSAAYIALTATANTTTISNCLMYNNTTKGALYLIGGTLYNCTVISSVAGAYIASATIPTKIYNSVFWGPTTGAGGITTPANNTTAVVQNCAYTSIQTANFITGSTLSNNIVLSLTNNGTDKPAPYFTNPATNDWTVTYQSSLLNAAGAIAGSPTTDLTGIARPQGGAADIGAYELPYYAITVTPGTNGSVTGYAASEPKGKSIAYTITPESDYVIDQVTYNGEDVTSSVADGVYTAAPLSVAATLDVTFKENTGTGLNTPKQSFQYVVKNNTLEVSGVPAGEVLTVYSVAGAKVAEQIISNGVCSVDLNSGIYVIRVANQVKKVVVK